MYKIYIYIILLLDLSFFYLIPMKGIFHSFIGNYQKNGIVIVTLIFIIISVKKIYRDKRFLFLKYILFFLLIYIMQFILSLCTYNQGIQSIVKVSGHFLVIMSYFLICYFIDNEDNGIDKLENIILIFSCIMSFLLLIQYLLYRVTGKLILFIDKSRALSSMRFGDIRVYESTYFTIFAAVLAFGLFLKGFKKGKKLYIFTIILSFLQLILISKNRMGLIMLIVSCIYMYIIKYKNNKLKGILVITTFVLVLIIFSETSILNNFFSTINSNDSSILTRVDAIQYYGTKIKEKFILGVGIIDPIENSQYFYLERGPYGKYYIDDMGILGLLYRFGLLGLIWYIMLIFKMISLLIKIYKNNMSKQYIEIYGLSFFVILGSIFMNPLDAQRITMFPFLLAILDRAYSSIINKRKL